MLGTYTHASFDTLKKVPIAHAREVTHNPVNIAGSTHKATIAERSIPRLAPDLFPAAFLSSHLRQPSSTTSGGTLEQQRCVASSVPFKCVLDRRAAPVIRAQSPRSTCSSARSGFEILAAAVSDGNPHCADFGAVKKTFFTALFRIYGHGAAVYRGSPPLLE